MKNENRTFYHKQVEEAFANFHRAFQEILKDVNADLLSPEFAVLSVFPEKIQWSKHESVAGLNLKEEEMSEEQKEEIALANKDYFDEAISSFNPLVYVNKFLQDYNKCLTSLTAIIIDAVEAYASINKNTISTEESATLPLTHEELYYAFSFLNKDQVREVLYGQQQIVFDKLYNAILEKDISGFKKALDEHPINQMQSLKYYLIGEVNNFSPFSDFIKSPELLNSSFLGMILEESGMPDDIIEYFDAFKKSHLLNPKNGIALNDFGSIDFGNLIDFQIQNLIGIHKLFFYSMDVPRFYRKRLLENYNEWRKEYPDAPDINIAAEIDIDVEGSINLTNVLMERWLIYAIHKRMESGENYILSDNEETEHEPELKEKRTTGDLRRLPFPSRIINNKIDGMLSTKILQRLYQVYGHYLTTANGRLISEGEFVYLFSGRIEYPSSYNPPYYWNTDINILAGLIRLLYDGQEKGFDTMILLPSDVGKNKSSIKWSTKKQGLGYKTLAPIENTIQSIIEDLSGKRLREVELKRQGKAK